MLTQTQMTLHRDTIPAVADETDAERKKIVAAMKNGKSLKVKGTSWRGKSTEDSYSLQGISSALAAIDKACK